MGVEMSFAARIAAALAVGLTAGILAGSPIAQAQPTNASIECVNPSSGTTWQIDVDYRRSTVDGNTARIDGAEISWRDRTDRRNYTLDRKTGRLTVIAASSTGGTIWFNRCKLP